MNKRLNKAIEILRKGGIVIFPTDTAFGIGCRIDSESGMKRLLKIRGRRKNQPFPVLISDIRMAKKYLRTISKEALELMEKHWPGPLTIILECKTSIINPVIRGLGKTLGVRIPDNKMVLELIKSVGVPIIGTSANYPGCKTPFSIKEVDPNLLSSVDFVLSGECQLGNQSTVIDCSENPWKILRQGAIEIQNSKEKVELYIDTANNEYISVELKINGKEYLKKQKINFQKAQVVLPMIEEILKEHKLSVRDLTSIGVNEGPGSYTGLRVGISAANALSHFLKIPINNKKLNQLAEPIYN